MQDNEQIITDDICVRRLSSDDLDILLEIENLSFRAPWSRESYTRELTENPLARYYGCFSEGRLVAFAGFWLILDEGHIANIAVHPLYRKKGFGELLMRQVMIQGLLEGLHWMTLEVRVSNEAARNLYGKLGFRDLGKRRAYYEDGEDAVIMWASLSGNTVKDLKQRGISAEN